VTAINVIVHLPILIFCHKTYSYVMSSFFWDVIQRVFVVSYRRFGTDKSNTPRNRTLDPWS